MEVPALKRRFVELFHASGWSQAETARRMDMTRGGINGIVTGPTVPSPGTVRFLEMLLLEAGAPVPGRQGGAEAGGRLATGSARPAPAAELAALLEVIHARNALKFESAKRVIEALYRQVILQPSGVSYGTKPAPKRPSGRARKAVRRPAAGAGA